MTQHYTGADLGFQKGGANMGIYICSKKVDTVIVCFN